MIKKIAHRSVKGQVEVTTEGEDYWGKMEWIYLWELNVLALNGDPRSHFFKLLFGSDLSGSEIGKYRSVGDNQLLFDRLEIITRAAGSTLPVLEMPSVARNDHPKEAYARVYLNTGVRWVMKNLGVPHVPWWLFGILDFDWKEPRVVPLAAKLPDSGQDQTIEKLNVILLEASSPFLEKRRKITKRLADARRLVEAGTTAIADYKRIGASRVYATHLSRHITAPEHVDALETIPARFDGGEYLREEIKRVFERLGYTYPKHDKHLKFIMWPLGGEQLDDA